MSKKRQPTSVSDATLRLRTLSAKAVFITPQTGILIGARYRFCFSLPDDRSRVSLKSYRVSENIVDVCMHYLIFLAK